ncbi:MAG: CDP-glucose 4,6-dehydratase, partial [Verrucomicrobia bacterium]|nr:CDP-glucose 4,6-dehydratase [Verrucomicrobiota bacterium]
MAFSDNYRGKRVLVTGHTGFKGSWLCEWLLALGADVTGFALDPNTTPALFNQLVLANRLKDVRGDVRDLAAVGAVVQRTQPDFIFHLAAQPLVRLSYDQPVETYATNVMGTVHVLEAARQLKSRCTVVAITTDKCYENREWVHSYREEDPMGGYDPYSSSKGAAELVVAAYRRSYFSSPGSLVRLASARAGNVIGGGDWALDRIVPDCIRALQDGRAIPVRNRVATRPWQHVLEPLSGYLWLGAKLAAGEVFVPILSGTLTTLAPFVPLAFWPGVVGKFMYFIPVTLIITLFASLIVAYIINPVFAVDFMEHEDHTT